jgi:hypothetical protein
VKHLQIAMRQTQQQHAIEQQIGNAILNQQYIDRGKVT